MHLSYNFFEWIAHIFQDFFFIPFEYIRHWQDHTWWGANLINMFFIIVFTGLFFYWVYKLKIFQDYDKDNTPETHR